MNLQEYRHPSNVRADDDPSHEYVDCVITNNKDTPNYEPQPMIFQQVKTSNIVDKANDYYLSIVRWSLHSHIPVIIPEIKIFDGIVPNAYTTDTTYWVNIGWGSFLPALIPLAFDNGASRNVKFIQENLALQKPPLRPSSRKELYNTDWYWVYSIQHFLDMVNLALSSSLTFLKANSGNHPSVSAIITNAVNPKFIWNSDTGKIDLLVSEEFVFDEDITPLPNKLFITMNNELMNLFDTFQYIKFDYNRTNEAINTLRGQNNAIICPYNYGIKSHIEKIGNTNKEIFIISQQSSSVPSWSPVQSIIFNSFMIPVHNSLTANPDFLGQNLSISNAQNTLSNIITDFTLPLVRGDEYSNQMTYYIPQSEYRLFDLSSDNPLNRLNIVVSWLDNLGDTHVLKIKYNTSATIKILLRKKSFNN